MVVVCPKLHEIVVASSLYDPDSYVYFVSIIVVALLTWYYCQYHQLCRWQVHHDDSHLGDGDDGDFVWVMMMIMLMMMKVERRSLL